MSTAFQFFNPAAKVTISHGHLPHWEQAGATYFITWRTADSIPREIWLRWREERDAWLLAHDINPASKDWRFDLEMLDEAAREDFRRFAVHSKSNSTPATATASFAIHVSPNSSPILCFISTAVVTR